MEFLIVCPLAFLAGFVDAVAGGGGLISLPAYLFAGLPVHMALGTTKAINLSTNVAALAVFLVNGSVLLPLGLVAGIFNIAGNWIGAREFASRGAALARPMMLVVIALFACKLVADLVV